MITMDDNEIRILMDSIQKALDSKNIPDLLEYYHPDVTYIGPAFPQPIRGLTDLKAAFVSHFQTPQRTISTVKQFRISRLGDTAFAVTALIEGRQIIYYSEQRFKGWLSRIFVDSDGTPRIILDHFTLSE